MNKKKKVILCSNYSWTIYNFRLPLARALRRSGFEVHLLTQRDRYLPIIKDEFDFIHELFIDRSGINPLSDLRTLLCIFRIVMKIKPEYFLAFTIKPVIYGGIVCRKMNVNFIANISGLGTVFIRESWITKIVQKMYKIALDRSYHVFFQNKDDCEKFLKNGLVQENTTSILPGSGVDLTEFSPSPIRLNSEKATERFSFLLIARMLWDKGIGEYIVAAKQIKNQFSDIDFLLLGFVGVDNPSAIRISQINEWERRGIIKYLGHTDDVRPHIQNADCVVLPSYREGTPRSLLESASMGKPIITTNAVGCKEVVEDGRNGFLCRVKDASDLAEKMKQMYNLPASSRSEMGEYGRKKMEEEFNIEIITDSYLNLLKTSS
ncbi:glycosyltransferase family 1 protein [Candidatus Poribacteria bacterium]|nr:glycosyltransferase family 1 protein [Candidatus Poribacteria bacterium]